MLGLFVAFVAAPFAAAQDCDPSTELLLDTEVPLVAGELFTLWVEGAPPGARVTFVRSGREEAEACPANLGGACLDVADPYVLATATADDDGYVQVEVDPAIDVASQWVDVQAASAECGGLLSDVVPREVHGNVPCAFTPEQWGLSCADDAPLGCVRDAWFEPVYPDGLQLQSRTLHDGTDAAAGVASGSDFDTELLALVLNLDFDAEGVFGPRQPLAEVTVPDGPYAGTLADELVVLAEAATDSERPDLVDAMAQINEGHPFCAPEVFDLPPPPPESPTDCVEPGLLDLPPLGALQVAVVGLPGDQHYLVLGASPGDPVALWVGGSYASDTCAFDLSGVCTEIVAPGQLHLTRADDHGLAYIEADPVELPGPLRPDATASVHVQAVVWSSTPERSEVLTVVTEHPEAPDLRWPWLLPLVVEAAEADEAEPLSVPVLTPCSEASCDGVLPAHDASCLPPASTTDPLQAETVGDQLWVTGLTAGQAFVVLAGEPEGAPTVDDTGIDLGLDLDSVHVVASGTADALGAAALDLLSHDDDEQLVLVATGPYGLISLP
jgi:hypothetical protein